MRAEAGKEPAKTLNPRASDSTCRDACVDGSESELVLWKASGGDIPSARKYRDEEVLNPSSWTPPQASLPATSLWLASAIVGCGGRLGPDGLT